MSKSICKFACYTTFFIALSLCLFGCNKLAKTSEDNQIADESKIEVAKEFNVKKTPGICSLIGAEDITIEDCLQAYQEAGFTPREAYKDFESNIEIDESNSYIIDEWSYILNISEKNKSTAILNKKCTFPKDTLQYVLDGRPSMVPVIAVYPLWIQYKTVVAHVYDDSIDDEIGKMDGLLDVVTVAFKDATEDDSFSGRYSMHTIYNKTTHFSQMQFYFYDKKLNTQIYKPYFQEPTIRINNKTLLERVEEGDLVETKNRVMKGDVVEITFYIKRTEESEGLDKKAKHLVIENSNLYVQNSKSVALSISIDEGKKSWFPDCEENHGTYAW